MSNDKSYEDAVKTIKSYPYALLYKFSELKLCSGPDVTPEDLEECMEGRFFNSSEELHIFPSDKMHYLIADDKDYGNNYLDQEYSMDSFTGNELSGTRVTVRQYFDTDEDGQTYIKAVRLVEVKK